MGEAETKPDYLKHRSRVRDRLLNGGAETLADYEILELLLAAGNPRGDTKPLAKELLRQFDNDLAAVLTAPPDRLRAIKGLGEAGIGALRIVSVAAARLAHAQAREQPVIGSWDRLLDYLTIRLAHEPVECFHVLFLDRKNKLIADERQQRGTVDHTPVYPREVVKRALELNASALILVHNHPSGDPTPSRADIEMTRELAEAAAKLGIVLHDHVVIARGGHASFRAKGLI
ncbi:DNA repair protein RadC [Tistlia consotensis]|uniref:DNA repair protein RadC n=1 Tax=Tistlia consotensis USBA 355 TaxID=560819 RepID=A0A1Y6CV94_9PROT|nr:DNA repair protein RadC [Tistlia consotensis]SMF79810.1 DNA repair protein RadC [Tistlia consotensis USBA 355]SNS16764.1 DNA repair protein RadC [Tistlia consotensis]